MNDRELGKHDAQLASLTSAVHALFLKLDASEQRRTEAIEKLDAKIDAMAVQQVAMSAKLNAFPQCPAPGKCNDLEKDLKVIYRDIRKLQLWRSYVIGSWAVIGGLMWLLWDWLKDHAHTVITEIHRR